MTPIGGKKEPFGTTSPTRFLFLSNDSAHAEQRTNQGDLKLRQVTYGRHAKHLIAIQLNADFQARASVYSFNLSKLTTMTLNRPIQNP